MWHTCNTPVTHRLADAHGVQRMACVVYEYIRTVAQMLCLTGISIMYYSKILFYPKGEK